ncbi:hypothetical protein GKZ89_15025 [Bacillus mangrovi]|uniref:Uracil-DNA glycosylase-like domain-containing protein n=1 Tax=Metabacillus mangrovi TaxID=1491830 RepID=A0A7X2S6T0_9BACI|nr:hypothetical protein [Metabacillus mangrovi]MTH54714.1 hypothetical protein [Metabacillus mangrovi]
MEKQHMHQAKALVRMAAEYEMTLNQTPLGNQLIEGAFPVVWLGESRPGSWLTIATNPSPKEFLRRDGRLLSDESARFPIRKLFREEEQLEELIEAYESYFTGGKAYQTWFGRQGGAKLEGFMNGLGGSFYSSNHHPVIHSDLFPYATRTHMGRLKEKVQLLNSPFTREFLQAKLEFLKPSLIVFLGKEHCSMVQGQGWGIEFEPEQAASSYPSARWQEGFYSKLDIPVLGLHFKPSEQFLGLGGSTDSLQKSHGTYGTRAALTEIGQEIKEKAKKAFS